MQLQLFFLRIGVALLKIGIAFIAVLIKNIHRKQDLILCPFFLLQTAFVEPAVTKSAQ